MPDVPDMPGDITFEEFFSGISDDRAFLMPPGEAGRFVPACCAMANGAGGWIIFDSALKDGDVLESVPSGGSLPAAEGVSDAEALEKQLSDILREARAGSAGVVSHFRAFPCAGSGKKILAARVEPADWRLRPVRVGKERRAYRRIEGENVISGRDTRWRMALDALESSRDDFTVPGLTVTDLDGESAASFRDKIIARFPGWGALSMESFLKRALVLDEDGGVTRAGELLLGKNSNLARISGQEVPNLWSACEILLPRMTKDMTASCAAAFRECFVNAMLHAEHDAGAVSVDFDDGMVIFSNPGLPRSLADGSSEARNYRLTRIFVMAGLAAGEGRGLDVIRGYDPDFRLSLDMLELATVSGLRLSASGKPVLGEPVPGEPVSGQPVLGEPDLSEIEPDVQEPDKPELTESKKAGFTSPGWMPVVQERSALRAVPDLPAPEADDEEDEYLGTSEDYGEEFSPLVKQVRETPRMSPDLVREAILELCADYKSLPELASILARSENSLRRHYVTSMAREGLLEMEFPDRVGHPDQRYRTV